jgi:hypothetical protein
MDERFDTVNEPVEGDGEPLDEKIARLTADIGD